LWEPLIKNTKKKITYRSTEAGGGGGGNCAKITSFDFPENFCNGGGEEKNWTPKWEGKDGGQKHLKKRSKCFSGERNAGKTNGGERIA